MLKYHPEIKTFARFTTTGTPTLGIVHIAHLNGDGSVRDVLHSLVEEHGGEKVVDVV